jgi:uncharacterized protein
MAHAHERALITGASSGIGAGFARVLPATTDLLLTGRSEERLRRISEDLGGRRRVDWVVADLATDDGRALLVERASQAKIDLLVCNAGGGWSGNFLDRPVSAAHETVNVNVLAVIDLVHALLPEMIARAHRSKRRAGVIIVSSVAAFSRAPAGIACYAASKAFALRLAQALAKEHSDAPVDVLALCPDWTDTDFFERAEVTPPQGQRMMSPDAVAKEGLDALGRRTVHLCSVSRSPALRPQLIRRLAAFNPDLAVWRWGRG